MTNPHHSMSHPTDPHPARPGTSEALFARTIDATKYSPLVRAQETVAALIPRVAVPLGSPLLLSMLGLTLVLLFLAARARFRLTAVLLPAVLLMALTSFRPMTSAEKPPIADDTVAKEPPSWTQFTEDQIPPPTPPSVEIALPSEIRVQLPATVMMMLEREEVRAAMEDLRFQLREELRREKLRRREWQHRY